MAKYSVVDVKKIDIWISAKLFDGSLNHELVSMKKRCGSYLLLMNHTIPSNYPLHGLSGHITSTLLQGLNITQH